MTTGRDRVTRRDVAVSGFQFHSTIFGVTIGMAITVYFTISALGRGPGFFFPIIPLAVWTPFLALHAYSVFRECPEDADETIRLPFVFDRHELEE